jgi:hypothetical protein
MPQKNLKTIFYCKIDLEETYDELVSNMSHKTEDVISF